MMFTLLGEVNLWTFDDNINIKDTDFGAFRYHDKRIDGLYEEGKRSYSQKRGMIYVPINKKGNKLKESIKYLEEQLRDNSTIYCQWYDCQIIQIILSNGLLISIQVNIDTGDIVKIVFDKYLLGRVLDHMSDVSLSKSHLICTYNDNQITVVYFTKSKKHAFDKINKLEPKLSTIDLFGHNGRRLDKKIQVNTNSDLVLIWWKSTMNEVYPWSPTVKEHDRANIHLYRLVGIKLDLICYIRTEFDPLCIIFDTRHNNIIHSVEQKVSRKGEVTIEWRTYEVSQQDKLQKIGVISVPLPTHTSCIKFSPSLDLLLLCCIDGSVMLYNESKATTNSIKAAFIPTLASWHSDGIIFAIGNDRGQFQHFDISLHCIKMQTLNEEASSTSILDLSSYFRNQPALLRMEWNVKTDSNSYVDYYNYGDSLFLLLFERGPTGVIRIIEGNNLPGDTLIRRYLLLSQVGQATSLLLTLNWDIHPRVCMHSLNQILNYLFKLPLTIERENLIQNALGSFHIPVKPISQAIEEEYGDEVRDLTRRFFHHLLRYQMFEKAFRLAIDLNDHDLFMDIHFYALVVNDMEMANAAKEKAEYILSRSNSCNSSHSTCSRESCSICSESTSDKGEESYSEDSEDSAKKDRTNFNHPKKHNYKNNSDNHIPPLPILYPSHGNNKTLLITSLNDIPPTSKSDHNIISTSFNTSNSILTTTAFNHSSHISISNTFLASTSFSTPPYMTYSNLMSTSISASTISSTNRFQPYNNFSEDLMTTSFGNISLNKEKSLTDHQHYDSMTETTFNRNIVNDTQYSSNDASMDVRTNLPEDSSFMSTSFNSPTYESIIPNIPSTSTITSLDTIDNNIMSTSFSTLVPSTSISCNNSVSVGPNVKCENTSSYLTRNIKTNNIPSNVISQISTDSIATNKGISTAYKSNSNPMSNICKYTEDHTVHNIDVETFHEEDNYSSDKCRELVAEKKHIDFDIPPPPSLTSTFTSYLQNLPKKNIPLSRSTSGLNIDESSRNNVSAKIMNITPRILQRQNSASNISQNQYTHTNFLSSKIHKLNPDLTYVPYHGSCDNIDMQHNNTNSVVSNLHNLYPTSNIQSKLFDGKHTKSGCHNSINNSVNKDTKILSNIPPLPVINVSNSNCKTCSPCSTFTDTQITSNEKPKVKFSDTVTHILVPGKGQSHRQKRSTITQLHITDPKRELAESLPLCLGNDDYLKDFQPLSKDAENETKSSSKPDESSKIKVVHFGLL